MPNHLQRYGGKGTWALVTGASDGIGATFCRQLAEQGFNIVLVSRTKSKLDAVEKEIKAINPACQTRIIQKDFCGNSNMEFYKKIKEEVSDLDIGLLVLCAGLLQVSPFTEISGKDS